LCDVSIIFFYFTFWYGIFTLKSILRFFFYSVILSLTVAKNLFLTNNDEILRPGVTGLGMTVKQLDPSPDAIVISMALLYHYLLYFSL